MERKVLKCFMCNEEKQMSTPAANTRLSTRLKEKKCGKERRESEHESERNPMSSRHERQVKKASILAQSVNKKNELVKKWLQRSEDIYVTNSKVQKEVHSHSNIDKSGSKALKQTVSTGGVKAKANSCSSEILFNFKKVDNQSNSGNMQSGTKQDSINSSDKRHKDTLQEDSIALGCSAMSGRSSTTRRRILRQQKLVMMSEMHSKTGDKSEVRETSGRKDKRKVTLLSYNHSIVSHRAPDRIKSLT